MIHSRVQYRDVQRYYRDEKYGTSTRPALAALVLIQVDIHLSLSLSLISGSLPLLNLGGYALFLAV